MLMSSTSAESKLPGILILQQNINRKRPNSHRRPRSPSGISVPLPPLPCPFTPGLFLSSAMPPKGNVSTRLNPLRLNTINHLRVRRPNKHEQNPCVTVMSTMLSTFLSHIFEAQVRMLVDRPASTLGHCHTEYIFINDPGYMDVRLTTVSANRLLGFSRIRGRRLRRPRDAIAQVYGRTGTFSPTYPFSPTRP